ncbi:hypothetical protein JG688_00005774 [Phytophthora aleatoria]|uniref:Uncharacterized protein n=1 Tax=Phytophthora aleatoria TaxID=2496075 RepID=A0A8J5M8C0_9STRA|nr:hypothetical protein JG688_00005774 [Phytophthora aleatoria]
MAHESVGYEHKTRSMSNTELYAIAHPAICALFHKPPLHLQRCLQDASHSSALSGHGSVVPDGDDNYQCRLCFYRRKQVGQDTITLSSISFVTTRRRMKTRSASPRNAREVWASS